MTMAEFGVRQGRRRAPLSYEEQQAELRKLTGEPIEGDDAAGGIEAAEALKEPEVNPEIYRDVDSYLFRGFLTQLGQVGETHFVFKTLNHHEHDLIRLSGGFDDRGQPTKRFWSLFLSYSVFMVDGVNILPERDKWIPKFSKDFDEFQVSIKTKIVRYLSELNRRARNAVTLTECYVMEKYSRYRWFQLHGLDMTSTAVTGISGSEQLGLNWAQLTWRALNRIDDLRDALEQQWEHAKFVGSCSAGKGIQKVYQQDTTRRRKEKETLMTRKDAILRHVIGGEPLHDDRYRIQSGGAVLVTAQTVEDLAKQLSSDLKGEKDWHDAVVDRYEGRMQAEAESRESQIRDLSEARAEEFGGKSLVGSTDMTGFSPAQIRDRMIRQAELEGKKLVQGRPPPSIATPEVPRQLPPAPTGPVVPAPAQRPPAQPFSRRR